ncbi:hypothetical protein RFI_38754 [Reticulomyxa filosa]|uniref:Uncharacterized protein n=1 Tax=Reticulomyxa filosa TaxID=46433 RepID=X6LDA8_RETFI|nr:hypothetical protein RFI_38754 [Reticulomyxa filosa]|eukprot:ETN98734.1 hypothetical protein RFI_38754 [Reticulomyxa filosa]
MTINTHSNLLTRLLSFLWRVILSGKKILSEVEVIHVVCNEVSNLINNDNADNNIQKYQSEDILDLQFWKQFSTQVIFTLEKIFILFNYINFESSNEDKKGNRIKLLGQIKKIKNLSQIM